MVRPYKLIGSWPALNHKWNRSSTVVQVRGYPGNSYQGYTTVADAERAWDFAVANRTVDDHSLPSASVAPSSPPSYVSTLPIPPAAPTQETRPTTSTLYSTSSPSSLCPAVAGPSRLSSPYISGVTPVRRAADPAEGYYYVVVRGAAPGVYLGR